MRTVRIGIYGGSFNPIHFGHINTAKDLISCNYVDEIKFMVTPQSPFKVGYTNVDAFHRYQMVKLACESDSNKLSPCDFEIRNYYNKRAAYTVDTLKAYIYSNLSRNITTDKDTHDYSADSIIYSYYFIVGMDTYATLKSFKDYKWLLNSGVVKLLVIPRDGYSTHDIKDKELTDALFAGKNVIYANRITETYDTSSTEIRNNIANNTLATNLLDYKVYDYILRNRLYQ